MQLNSEIIQFQAHNSISYNFYLLIKIILIPAFIRVNKFRASKGKKFFVSLQNSFVGELMNRQDVKLLKTVLWRLIVIKYLFLVDLRSVIKVSTKR